MPSSSWRPQPSQATPVSDRLVREVTVTDRRHSLYGQCLEVSVGGSSRGPDWVTVLLPDGRRRHIRRAATNLARAPEEQPTADLDGARISVRTLLPLAQCLRALLKISGEDVTDGQPRSILDQPSDRPVQECAGGGTDAVVGLAAGRQTEDRQGICPHGDPDADATAFHHPGGEPC